ncbi:enterocin immunity protein [Companilactobacillus kimchii]|nr:enterocin immunity protein [Companilactobacillus kimchii]
MSMENQELFDLIDTAYNEDLSEQPKEYKDSLLKAAQKLLAGGKEVEVCADIYQSCHDNYIVPMGLPRNNRALYQYVKDKLHNPSEKEMRDLNLGYGLISTNITFGSMN